LCTVRRNQHPGLPQSIPPPMRILSHHFHAFFTESYQMRACRQDYFPASVPMQRLRTCSSHQKNFPADLDLEKEWR
jgi:hypothetical protein